MDGDARDELALDAETMRALGYRTVDMLTDWLARDRPPLERASPAEMSRLLPSAPPARAAGIDELLEQLVADVLPYTSRGDHPGFFAFVPFSGTWPGALGDFIASACNVYAGSWMESSGPSRLELVVLDWFKSWIGYPAGAAGALVSGGSAANMTALACARETRVGAMRDDVVAYVSDQAHSSLARAARILGFRPNQMRVLPSDADFRLDPATLERAIETDVRAGRKPLFVSASAGATNTGSVDPLAELADVCRDRDVWLHADAAYGGFAVLTERGRAALAGIDRADSVTLDPHKWLYQPYECGCLLVRDGDALRSSFEITPDYLRDAAVPGTEEVNFADYGLQLTRMSRALKVWLSLRYFGLDAFRAAIERSLDLAEHVAARVEACPELELLAPPSLGVVCFRRRCSGDEAAHERLNAGLVAGLERSGLGLVSSTRLHGRYALRICVLSHTSQREDVDRVLDYFEAAQPEPEPAGPKYERHPEVTRSWLATPSELTATVRRLPLFASLGERDADRVAALGHERLAASGESVVAQWSEERDFFVIVEGTADVYVEDDHIRELGPGDFFGELAALDWGAGFSYPRLASVVAGSPLRLLVFPEGGLNEIVNRFPAIDSAIRAAVTERLPRHA